MNFLHVDSNIPTKPAYGVCIMFYKITKIVPRLVERSVCMRVCKHGCDVKMFCFSRANHTGTTLKKFSSSKFDKFLYLPIPSSAETWKIITKKVSIFFSLKLTF